MVKTKRGFILRRLGQEHMIVPVGEASKGFNGMIRLNETGAFYWKELEQGITEEMLVEKAMERFEDLEQETAQRDIREFLDSIQVALETEDGQ